MLATALVKKFFDLYKRFTNEPVDVSSWEEFLDKLGEIGGNLEVRIFIRNCDRRIYFVSFDGEGIEKHRCFLYEFSSAVLPSNLLLTAKAKRRMDDCLKRWDNVTVKIYSFDFDEFSQPIEKLILDSSAK